jgi:aminomethyltransferase
MNDQTGKSTPLFDLQETLGARFVDFGGWNLPVMYTSIVEETEAVRSKAGLFDVSHMGRFFVSGEDSEKALDRIVTRDLTDLEPGHQRYSLLLSDEGTILDDLMVARITDIEFLVVANAGNLDKDRDRIVSLLAEEEEDVWLHDRSSETVMLALQGPDSESILKSALELDASDMKFLEVVECSYCGIPLVLSRSGYTGSDGFEIIAPNLGGREIWTDLISAGALPCGLGARDILRLEVAYPLYGHELTDSVRPNECGLTWTLSKKNPFAGSQAALAHTPASELIGFVLEKKSIPRQGFPVEVSGRTVGQVTSGGLSNRLPNGFGIARVEKGSVAEDLEVAVRDRRVPAKKVKTPFIPDQVKR